MNCEEEQGQFLSDKNLFEIYISEKTKQDLFGDMKDFCTFLQYVIER